MRFCALLTTSAALALTASARPQFNVVAPSRFGERAAARPGCHGNGTHTRPPANVAVASATSVASATGAASSSRPSSSSAATAATAAGAATDACDIGYCTQEGGTTGGGSGSATTVTTLEELKSAAEAEGAAIIIVSGEITGADVVNIASDKTVIGATGSSLTGVGLRVKDVSNVIIRNMKISKVLADTGDAIGIQAADHVWVDHCDLSSDMDHGKDYYDGLCDISHAADYITVSNTHFHDHYKASLVGHSDDNSAEDTGHLIITYANNYWSNVNSRAPSFRFGTGHIFNSYMENLDTGINTRMGAELLVESCAFSGVEAAIESESSDTAGYATVEDVDLGGGENTAEAGDMTSVPYEYTLLGADSVQSVASSAGQTLDISAS